ncbi:MAG: hypothetical protein WCY19_02645 [Candidatus Gastranaerophilaceae bacterium]
MDKQFILELIKVASPYIVAILGILSPIFTIKYLNSQDLIKFKKQKLHDVKIKVYPKFIIELNELKRMFDILVQMADFYKKDNKSDEFLDVLKNKSVDENYLKEILEYTKKYNEVIKNCEQNIKKMYDENFSYLNKHVTKKLKDILESLNSTEFLFNWRINLFSIEKDKLNVDFKYLENLYLSEEEDAKDKAQKINDLIVLLKYEINGEN